MREGKGSVYEGGVRVPMMVYWPGKTEAGMRINTPVTPPDFYPSICEMAGVENPETVQKLDGKSFVKLVTDGSQLAKEAVEKGKIRNQKEANAFVIPEKVSGLDPERVVISHMPHQWRIEDQEDVDFLSAIRKGDWKLVYRMHDGRLELYNLKKDLSEKNDVSENSLLNSPTLFVNGRHPCPWSRLQVNLCRCPMSCFEAEFRACLKIKVKFGAAHFRIKSISFYLQK